MKQLLIKALSIFIFVVITLLIIKEENSFSSSYFEKAVCPITINFCISGAGSGVAITIFTGDDCTGPVVTTIYTNSSGCAQYTFTSNCDSVHTVKVTSCEEGNPQCRYFYPDAIGNNGTFPVAPCP